MSTQDNLTIAQDIYTSFGQGNIPAIWMSLPMMWSCTSHRAARRPSPVCTVGVMEQAPSSSA